jgi:hypothetical protein
MNWATFGNLGWLATAILGLISWAIYRQALHAADSRIKENQEERDAVVKRMADYDARVEHIVRNVLNEFENRMFTRINGTYVRSKEAELRFESLSQGIRRIEESLATLSSLQS